MIVGIIVIIITLMAAAFTFTIIEEHDGHIDYFSGIGKGTTFYVDLPKLGLSHT